MGQTSVRQTGLIYEVPKPTDWLAGGETGISDEVRLFSGDWTPYLPTEERQSRRDQYYFDTASCVTFSALNSLESQFNLLLREQRIPDEVLIQLINLGYIVKLAGGAFGIDQLKLSPKDYEFSLSDRYTAIMSGTTKDGNTLTKVWDSIRKDGLLPEKDFPFGGTSFAEYHNRNLITPEMRAKAKTMLGFFKFNYDWSFTSFDDETTTKARKTLTVSPIHGAIPGHAIMYFKWNEDGSREYFDSYPAYRKGQGVKDKTTRMGLRGVVSLKDRIFPIYVFNVDLYKGVKGQDVFQLQKVLKTLGFLSVNETGEFGPLTEQAVKDFQMSYGIRPYSGYVGPKTRSVLNAICSYDDPQGQDVLYVSSLDKIIEWVKKWF